jgi:hypothetical protein
MKILLVIMGCSLLLSIFFNYLFNWIVAPKRMDWEKKGRQQFMPPITARIDGDFYRANKPMILRESGFLDFLVQLGGVMFYVVFSIVSLIVSFAAGNSFWWTLACIPVLYIGLQIMDFLTMMVARFVAARNFTKYGDG